MDILVFINYTIKYVLLNFFTFYVISKIINYKYIDKKNITITVISSISLGLFYSITINFALSFLIVILMYILHSFISSFIYKKNIPYILTIDLLSTSITYIFYTIGVLVASIIAKLPIINLTNNNPFILLLALILCFFFIYHFFRINRFKKGFSFLKDEEKLNSISIIGLLLCGFCIIIYSILRYTDDLYIFQFFVLAVILIFFGIFIWIKRNLKINYKEKMKDQTIEILKMELENEALKNDELKKEIENLSMINHKYSSRIKATEQNISKLAYAYTKSKGSELSSELSDITDEIKHISNEYTNEITNLLKYSKILPKTNIPGIDMMFEHMQIEALKNNINFDLSINCSINLMIEKFIPQNMLETLIGDHLKDAIISINSGNNANKDIFVQFEIMDNYYELCIFDNGIKFDIDTLLELGLKPVTTHKHIGGSGLGFMTTFDTLKKCNASLIIEEINFKNSNFSKAIKFRFNNKNEYIIRTLRWKEIKSKDSLNRILLEDLPL